MQRAASLSDEWSRNGAVRIQWKQSNDDHVQTVIPKGLCGGGALQCTCTGHTRQMQITELTRTIKMLRLWNMNIPAQDPHRLIVQTTEAWKKNDVVPAGGDLPNGIERSLVGHANRLGSADCPSHTQGQRLMTELHSAHNCRELPGPCEVVHALARWTCK